MLFWLQKMESVELDEEEMAPIIRLHNTNSGTIRKCYYWK